MQLSKSSIAANVAVSDRTLRYLRIIGGVLCLLIFASNLWSMSRWNERRGVVDDLCYLRQAHLFQKFGYRGLDTDILPETDNYFRKLVNEAGHPEWHSANGSWCHVQMEATGKRVIQYPPGTGFLLAAFPEGFQVIPLYAAATFLISLIAIVAINFARSKASIATATAFGCLALYFMINPAKASYSIPPTLVVCAVAGFLTAAVSNCTERRSRLGMTFILGILLGISVNFRVANLVLSAGYFAAFLIAFVWTRRLDNFWQGILFGLAYLIGLMPTLLANAINAGSPFSTTYGPDDTQSRHFVLSVAKQYFSELQGGLMLVGFASVACILMQRPSQPLKQTTILVAGNLFVNLVFFLIHPIYQQFYLMPVAMLSFWSLLFGVLMQNRVSIPLEAQPIKVQT
jgi:hypothetical protein